MLLPEDNSICCQKKFRGHDSPQCPAVIFLCIQAKNGIPGIPVHLGKVRIPTNLNAIKA
jgi:hypothetical protein